VPAVASTPGKECLTSPVTFAKRKTALESIFRASRNPVKGSAKYLSIFWSASRKMANEVKGTIGRFAAGAGGAITSMTVDFALRGIEGSSPKLRFFARRMVP
jgi:hypothetical protein